MLSPIQTKHEILGLAGEMKGYVSLKSMLVPGVFGVLCQELRKIQRYFQIWSLPQGTIVLVGVTSHGDK